MSPEGLFKRVPTVESDTDLIDRLLVALPDVTSSGLESPVINTAEKNNGDPNNVGKLRHQPIVEPRGPHTATTHIYTPTGIPKPSNPADGFKMYK